MLASSLDEINYVILHYAILHKTIQARYDERIEQPVCHWEICKHVFPITRHVFLIIRRFFDG